MINDVLWNILTASSNWSSCSYLHCNIVCKVLEVLRLSGLWLVELKGNNVSKLATKVDVASKSAICSLNALKTKNAHVLADVVNLIGDCLINGLVAKLGSLELLDVSWVALNDNCSKIASKASELWVSTNKVSLAGELENCTSLAVWADESSNGALVGVAASTLNCLSNAHSTKDVYCLLNIALSLDECLLALHHRRAGHITKLLNKCCGNLCHVFLPKIY